MSTKTFRKVQASMMIVMLSVAERHQIRARSSYRATSRSVGAAHNREQVELAAGRPAAQVADPKLREREVAGRAEEEAMRAEPLALVEVNKWRGQASATERLLPRTAGALNIRTLSRAPTSPVDSPMLASSRDPVNLRNRPTLASGRLTMKLRKPLTLASENKRCRAPRMSRTGTAAHTPNQGISHAGPVTNTHGSILTSTMGPKMLMPVLIKALSRLNPGPVMLAPLEKNNKGFPTDAPVLLCFALWYLGGFYNSINNKLLLKAAGGATGLPMTMATLELGVSVIYALVCWTASDGRRRPNVSLKDYVSTLPVGAVFAGTHIGTIFALSVGAVSFGQIVRSADPAFVAVVGLCLYGAKLSTAQWFTLVPALGGVILASVNEVNRAMSALVTVALASVFNAIRSNEIERSRSDAGISDRIAGNLYAIMAINTLLFTLPPTLWTGGKPFGQFLNLMTAKPALLQTLVAAGFGFVISSEFRTQSIENMGTDAIEVARTAARVVFIIVSAHVLKESFRFLKLLGPGVTIGGVLLSGLIYEKFQARFPPPPDRRPAEG